MKQHWGFVGIFAFSKSSSPLSVMVVCERQQSLAKILIPQLEKFEVWEGRSLKIWYKTLRIFFSNKCCLSFTCLHRNKIPYRLESALKYITNKSFLRLHIIIYGSRENKGSWSVTNSGCILAIIFSAVFCTHGSKIIPKDPIFKTWEYHLKWKGNIKLILNTYIQSYGNVFCIFFKKFQIFVVGCYLHCITNM